MKEWLDWTKPKLLLDILKNAFKFSIAKVFSKKHKWLRFSHMVGLFKYRIILVANSLQMDHFHENISFLEKFREIITSQQHLYLFTSARAIFEFVVILRQTKQSRSKENPYNVITKSPMKSQLFFCSRNTSFWLYYEVFRCQNELAEKYLASKKSQNCLKSCNSMKKRTKTKTNQIQNNSWKSKVVKSF